MFVARLRDTSTSRGQSRKGAVSGCGHRVCCSEIPAQWRGGWRRPPGCGGRSGAGWRAASTPSCFPRCCFPFVGTWSVHLMPVPLWFFPSQRQAKRLLGQIVDRCRNGPGFHNDMDGNSTVQEILIPASKVGLVIGKGGETIKQLQVREPQPVGLAPRRPGLGGPIMTPSSVPGSSIRQLWPGNSLWPGLVPGTMPVLGPRELVAAIVAMKLRYHQMTASQMRMLCPEPGALSQCAPRR